MPAGVVEEKRAGAARDRMVGEEGEEDRDGGGDGGGGERGNSTREDGSGGRTAVMLKGMVEGERKALDWSNGAGEGERGEDSGGKKSLRGVAAPEFEGTVVGERGCSTGKNGGGGGCMKMVPGRPES